MNDVISDLGRTYLHWTLIDGVGPLTFSRLVEQLGDPAQALHASAAVLQSVPGIGPKTADRIAASRDAAALDPEIEAAAEHGVRIVCRADDDYPPGLRHIPDAPLVLYVKGELQPTDVVALAIVGSRRCSIYGSEQARRFGELLAGAGFTVVSGLARGIDAFAHHGAIDAGGRTLAVMGRGLTEIYPPENAGLAEKLLNHGAWVSELPMQASVRAENFPGRNRIIAGMTLGTLVVEAAQRSGALITARLANEYNREVFAIPGRVQDPMSFGTNALIRNGAAKLVMTLEDILEELGDVGATLQTYGAGDVQVRRPQQADLFAAANEHAQTRTAEPPVPTVALTDAEQGVLNAVPAEPALQDTVLRTASLPTGQVLAALTALELKGLVRRLPGGLVQRRRS
jgi:DNA processing protein